jgi:TorA maturation chaperone TorD
MANEPLIAQGIDAETGETFERELTSDEIAEIAEWAESPSIQELMNAKAAARESALAKLADLGLTAEEIAAL